MKPNKTVPTKTNVEIFLNSIRPETKKRDSKLLLEIMKDSTQELPVMWGTSIIGFGSAHYKYESGREGDMPIVGFSPRKQALTLYLTSGFESFESLVGRLGKIKRSKACIYIKHLEDIDIDILRTLIQESFTFGSKNGNINGC